MMEDYLTGKVISMRTLPTIILKIDFVDIKSYEFALRHNYRRRLKIISEKFSDVTTVTTDCSHFNTEHYRLYLMRCSSMCQNHYDLLL